MSRLLRFFAANTFLFALASLLLLAGSVQAATILFPSGGGLGSNAAPTLGKIPVGTSGGVYAPTSTIRGPITVTGTTTLATTTIIGSAGFSGTVSITGTTTLGTTTIPTLNTNMVFLGQGQFASTSLGVNKAIGYLTSVGGGTIQLGCGDYYFQPEVILLQSRITIQGLSRDCTVIHAINNGGYSRLFDIGTSSQSLITDVHFKNLFLTNRDRNPLGTTPDNNTYALAFFNASHISVENVRTEMFSDDFAIHNSSYADFLYDVDLSGYNGPSIGGVTGWGAKNHIDAGNVTHMTIDHMTSYINDTVYRLMGVQHVLVSNNIVKYGGIEIGNAEGQGYVEDVHLINNTHLENDTNAVNFVAYSEDPTQTQRVSGYNSAVNNVSVIGDTFTFGDAQGPTAITFGSGTGAKASTTAITNVEIAGNTVNATTSNNTHTAFLYGMANSATLVNFNSHNNIITNTTNEGYLLASIVHGKVHDDIITGFNQRNCIDATRRCAAIYIAGNPDVFSGGTASSSTNDLQIYNETINATTTNSIGIYIDNPQLIYNLQLGPNNITASTTVKYASTAPTLKPTNFLGPISIGTSTLASTTIRGDATSTFGGGVNLINGQCFAIGGVCLQNFTLPISQSNGGTGAASIGSNMLIANNGSGVIVSTSTPTAAAYLATSTSATSTFQGTLLARSGGLVGINQGTPLYKLDVLAGTTGAAAHFGQAADDGMYLNVGSGDSANFTGGMASIGGSWIAKNASAEIFSLAAGGAEWYGNTGLTPGNSFGPTIRMKLTSGGNLGIGVTPTRTLSIANGDGSSNVVAGFDNTSQVEKGFIGVIGTTGSFITSGQVNDFFIRANGGSLVLTTGPAGEVAQSLWMKQGSGGQNGFGTNSPGAKLEVSVPNTNNNVALKLSQLDSTNNLDAFQIANSGTGNYITANTFVLKSNGNVGIGTTTPATRLQVSSGANATTTVTVGELGLTSSKSCVNMNAADGSASSFYINAAHAIVVEANYCR